MQRDIEVGELDPRPGWLWAIQYTQLGSASSSQGRLSEGNGVRVVLREYRFMRPSTSSSRATAGPSGGQSKALGLEALRFSRIEFPIWSMTL